MKKSSITIIIYVLGLIFSALVSSFWDAKTGSKAIILNALDFYISYYVGFIRKKKILNNQN